jgi:hypothetical protein
MRNGWKGHVHEFIAALELAARRELVSPRYIFNRLEDAESDGLDFVGEKVYLYLGTSLKTHKKLVSSALAGTADKDVQRLVNRCLDFYSDLAVPYDYHTVYADGGTGSKSDVTLTYPEGKQVNLSLKWSNKSTFNQQTPGQKSMSNWLKFDRGLEKACDQFTRTVTPLVGDGGDKAEREYKKALDIFFTHLDKSFENMQPENFVAAARHALTDNQPNTMLINLSLKSADVYRLDARSQQLLKKHLSEGYWEVEVRDWNGGKSALRTYTHTSGVQFQLDYGTRTRTHGGTTRQIEGHNARWSFINI